MILLFFPLRFVGSSVDPVGYPVNGADSSVDPVCYSIVPVGSSVVPVRSSKEWAGSSVGGDDFEQPCTTVATLPTPVEEGEVATLPVPVEEGEVVEQGVQLYDYFKLVCAQLAVTGSAVR